MPRIAVAIFVVVAVSVSIGINIARYPAVFDMAGSTHESLVSDDTTDVSEAKETEGPVAVNTMPALPDEDLDRWNPPMVNSVKPTVTEAVPHVASSNAYENDAYPQTEDDKAYSDYEPEATSMNEATPEGEDVKPELNRYEVEPYRPYTSQPVEEKREESVTEKKQEEPAAVSQPESVREDPIYKSSTTTGSGSAYGDSYDGHSAAKDSGYGYSSGDDGDTYQPGDRSEGYESSYRESSDDSPVWREQQPSGVSDDSDRTSQHVSAPVSEMRSTGHWPATVAEVFRYKQDPDNTSGKPSFYDRAPGDGYDHQTNIHEVSSSRSVANATLPRRNTSEEYKEALQGDDSGTRVEKIEWKAVGPMVAVRDDPPIDKDLPLRQIERLPSTEGTEVLPGSLPSPETMDYPVTK